MTSEPPSTASPADRSAIDQDVFCLGCGYNLRGLEGDRCPECGRTFDRATLSVSQIPWIYRGQIGAFRAYWRTVALVVHRNRRFCEQIAHPVPYRSAQTFRWVTILHLYLPLLLGTMAAYAFASARQSALGPFDEVFQRVWPVASIHVGVLLFLVGVTGAPSYFFHPRVLPVEQQNRAVAMSYYACASLVLIPLMAVLLPLGWAPLVLFVGTGGLSPGEVLDAFDKAPLAFRVWTIALIVVGLVVTFLQPIIWWWGLVDMARQAMLRRRRRVVLLAVLLPIVWLAIAALTLFGIPFAAVYVALIFVSLG